MQASSAGPSFAVTGTTPHQTPTKHGHGITVTPSTSPGGAPTTPGCGIVQTSKGATLDEPLDSPVPGNCNPNTNGGKRNTREASEADMTLPRSMFSCWRCICKPEDAMDTAKTVGYATLRLRIMAASFGVVGQEDHSRPGSGSSLFISDSSSRSGDANSSCSRYNDRSSHGGSDLTSGLSPDTSSNPEASSSPQGLDAPGNESVFRPYVRLGIAKGIAASMGGGTTGSFFGLHGSSNNGEVGIGAASSVICSTQVLRSDSINYNPRLYRAGTFGNVSHCFADHADTTTVNTASATPGAANEDFATSASVTNDVSDADSSSMPTVCGNMSLGLRYRFSNTTASIISRHSPMISSSTTSKRAGKGSSAIHDTNCAHAASTTGTSATSTGATDVGSRAAIPRAANSGSRSPSSAATIGSAVPNISGTAVSPTGGAVAGAADSLVSSQSLSPTSKSHKKTTVGIPSSPTGSGVRLSSSSTTSTLASGFSQGDDGTTTDPTKRKSDGSRADQPETHKGNGSTCSTGNSDTGSCDGGSSTKNHRGTSSAPTGSSGTIPSTNNTGVSSKVNNISSRGSTSSANDMSSGTALSLSSPAVTKGSGTSRSSPMSTQSSAGATTSNTSTPIATDRIITAGGSSSSRSNSKSSNSNATRTCGSSNSINDENFCSNIIGSSNGGRSDTSSNSSDGSKSTSDDSSPSSKNMHSETRKTEVPPCSSSSHVIEHSADSRRPDTARTKGSNDTHSSDLSSSSNTPREKRSEDQSTGYEEYAIELSEVRNLIRVELCDEDDTEDVVFVGSDDILNTLYIHTHKLTPNKPYLLFVSFPYPGEFRDNSKAKPSPQSRKTSTGTPVVERRVGYTAEGVRSCELFESSFSRVGDSNRSKRTGKRLSTSSSVIGGPLECFINNRAHLTNPTSLRYAAFETTSGALNVASTKIAVATPSEPSVVKGMSHSTLSPEAAGTPGIPSTTGRTSSSPTAVGGKTGGNDKYGSLDSIDEGRHGSTSDGECLPSTLKQVDRVYITLRVVVELNSVSSAGLYTNARLSFTNPFTGESQLSPRKALQYGRSATCGYRGSKLMHELAIAAVEVATLGAAYSTRSRGATAARVVPGIGGNTCTLEKSHKAEEGGSVKVDYTKLYSDVSELCHKINDGYAKFEKAVLHIVYWQSYMHSSTFLLLFVFCYLHPSFVLPALFFSIGFYCLFPETSHFLVRTAVLREAKNTCSTGSGGDGGTSGSPITCSRLTSGAGGGNAGASVEAVSSAKHVTSGTSSFPSSVGMRVSDSSTVSASGSTSASSSCTSRNSSSSGRGGSNDCSASSSCSASDSHNSSSSSSTSSTSGSSSSCASSTRADLSFGLEAPQVCSEDEAEELGFDDLSGLEDDAQDDFAFYQNSSDANAPDSTLNTSFIKSILASALTYTVQYYCQQTHMYTVLLLHALVFVPDKIREKRTTIGVWCLLLCVATVLLPNLFYFAGLAAGILLLTYRIRWLNNWYCIGSAVIDYTRIMYKRKVYHNQLYKNSFSEAKYINSVS